MADNRYAADAFAMRRLRMMQRAGLVPHDDRMLQNIGAPAAWWRAFSKNHLVPLAQEAGYENPMEFVKALIAERRGEMGPQ